MGTVLSSSILVTGMPTADALVGAALLTKKNSQSQAQQTATEAIGSTISVGSLVTDSGRDTTMQASTVVADGAIAMHAGRNLNVLPGENTQTEQTAASSKTSGFIGDLWQPAIGTVKQSNDGKQAATTQTGSQIASLAGSVNLTADGKYTQTASSVLAPQGDIDIAAKQVQIDAANNTSTGSDHSTYSKTAVGGSVSVPLLNAMQGLAQTAQSAGKTQDTRMQALAGLNAAMQAKDVLDAGQALAGGNLGGVKVSVSVSNTKRENTTEQSASTAVGSQIAAGGQVVIQATGAGKDSTLAVIGSDIIASGKATLKADGAIDLQAAQSSSEQHSKNSSSGASVGVGFAIGGQQNGFTLDVSASKGKGRADGSDLTQVNTHVSGQQVDLQSGGDTTLKGAVLKADQVTGNIGGNLNLESLQDKSTYAAKQESAGFSASVCVPPFCYGTSTVSGSYSNAKVNGSSLTVKEQSGLFAGDGGFQLDVKGGTSLTGAAITSSQAAVDAQLNSLKTASITATDLQNHDSYKASGVAVS
ncbi:filamentous hemagglutinin, partial [Pelomonas sp. HMWF004]